MTAIAFHSISIVLLIIGIVAGISLVISAVCDRMIMMLLGSVAVVLGLSFGIQGLTNYKAYKSYSEDSIYAEYIPEQMSYRDWINRKWVVEEISCPNCGTEVSIKYIYCPECNYFLQEGYICPECGGEIQKTDIYCPWCGADLQ